MQQREGTISSCIRLASAYVAVVAALLVITGHAKAASDEDIAVRLYKKVAPATVFISSAYISHHHLPGSTSQDTSIGSGFLLNKDGEVITNAHVIEGAANVTVSLQDGTRLAAEVVGSDAQSDIALLRVALPKGHHAVVQLGDSDRLEVGQRVFAIGHPFGLGYAFTTGLVSGFGRVLGMPNIFQERVIQTSAAINPGNSGGPLIDADGKVVGVNAAVLMGAQSIGFSIPINKVKSIIAELSKHGRVIRPWVGTGGKLVTDSVRGLIALPLAAGFLIMDVEDGSPAEQSGLRAGNIDVVIEGEPWVLGGDIILEINGRSVGTPEDYTQAVSQLKIGQSAAMKVMRNGEYMTVTVTPKERTKSHQASARPPVKVPPVVPQRDGSVPRDEVLAF